MKSCKPLCAPQTSSACFLAETEQCSIVSRHPYQMNSAQLSSFAVRGESYLFSITVTPGSVMGTLCHNIICSGGPFSLFGLVTFIYDLPGKQNILYLCKRFPLLFLYVLTACPTLLSAVPLGINAARSPFIKTGIQMSHSCSHAENTSPLTPYSPFFAGV